MADLSEEQLLREMQKKQSEKIKSFIEDFKKLENQYGLTFGGRAMITGDGKIAVEIDVIVKRT